MSRQASVLIPTPTVAATGGTIATSSSDIVVTLSASTASGNITIGKNRIFVVQFSPTATPAAPANMNISFGNSATTVVVPTAGNCYAIPAQQQTTFDMGPTNDTINIISGVAGTC